MITRTNAYQVANKTFATLEEARAYELETIIQSCTQHDHIPALAIHLINNKALLVDILTTGPRSKPRKRKTIQSQGGKARALALSPERKTEIAKQAAEVRWANEHAKTVTPL